MGVVKEVKLTESGPIVLKVRSTGGGASGA